MLHRLFGSQSSNLRTLYVTGLTTSLLAFAGGMATCAVIIWAATTVQAGVSEMWCGRPMPQSIEKAGLQDAYLALSEDVSGGGVRFPGRCGTRFHDSLGCLTVREVSHRNKRLGLRVEQLNDCQVCRDVGLKVSDVITHLRHGTGRRRPLMATPDLARWLKLMPRPSAAAPLRPQTALTLRILRDGRPVLLTRHASLVIDGERVP